MKRVRFIATKIVASELQPGDLFSMLGPWHWNFVDRIQSVGECVYFRTNTPADQAPDSYEEVYKITTEITEVIDG